MIIKLWSPRFLPNQNKSWSFNYEAPDFFQSVRLLLDFLFAFLLKCLFPLGRDPSAKEGNCVCHLIGFLDFSLKPFAATRRVLRPDISPSLFDMGEIIFSLFFSFFFSFCSPSIERCSFDSAWGRAELVKLRLYAYKVKDMGKIARIVGRQLRPDYLK